MSNMAANLGNWQREIDLILRNADCLDQFGLLKNDEDRIAMIMSKNYLTTIDWLVFYFENCHKIHLKSSEKSRKFREQGNKCFQSKLYHDSLELYTKSVLHAPLEETSDDLCLAYGNRSAALYHIGQLKVELKHTSTSSQFNLLDGKSILTTCQENVLSSLDDDISRLFVATEYISCISEWSREILIQTTVKFDTFKASNVRGQSMLGCLDDIENAVTNGYPKHLAHKLYLRKAQCLSSLGCTEDAEKSLLKAREYVTKNFVLDQKKKVVVLQDIVNCAKKIQSQDSDKDLPSRGCQEYSSPVVSHGSNAIITQATGALKMVYTPGKGRHLLAVDKIKAGDTLIVEQPYAAVLLPDHYQTHCHHCFVQLESVVPCRRCTQVQYCTVACRDASWTSYHHIECRYLDLLHSVGIAHLSLRIVLTAGLLYLKDFMDSYENLSSKDRIGGVTEEGQYDKNYLSVYELLTHSHSMVTEDLFQYTLTGFLLLRILKLSDWFDSGDITQNKMEVHIGGILLRHILQLVCNAHAITELQISQTDDHSLVEAKSQVRVATAIYPTASLMNHSCDPTVISSFKKDLLVVKAVKDVPVNGEIFNCYGPHYKRMSRTERQLVLREQYMFDCDCEACCKEETDSLVFCAFKCPKDSSQLREEGESVLCSECDFKDKSMTFREKGDKAYQLFVQALHALESQNIQEAIKLLLKCYDIQKQVLYKFHKSLAETQDCLAKCYSIMGEYRSACKYLKDSVKTVKELYSDSSVEYANELHKFAEVLCNAGKHRNALKLTDNAITIFKLHYANNHSCVGELEELRSNLQRVLNIS